MRGLLQFSLLCAIVATIGIVGLSLIFTVDVGWKMYGEGHHTFAIFWGIFGLYWTAFWLARGAKWIEAPLTELRALDAKNGQPPTNG